MGNQTSHRQYSQRQLRVGELVKQNLGELLIRNEAKIPLINSKLITVTEVKMTPDLKTARVYVIPLGGIDTKETVKILTDYSHLVRKALAKRLDIKFLPKLTFVSASVWFNKINSSYLLAEGNFTFFNLVFEPRTIYVTNSWLKILFRF